MTTENRDKRSVATDALQSLGTIIGDSEKRDAIHLAVEPVEAGETIWPGQHVGIHNGKAYATGDHRKLKALGISDPFLKSRVETGSRFWLIVYPRQITSLRHVWEHPDFPETVVKTLALDQADNSAAKHRIIAWANNEGIDYDELIEHAVDHAKRGTYWNEGGRFEGVYQYHGFWDDIEAVTGVKNEHSDYFFSCSC